MGSVTILLNLPEELAAEFRRIPEPERSQYALALLRAGKQAENQFDQRNTLSSEKVLPTSADDLTAIGRGLADADAGRVTDGPVFFAEMMQHLEELKQQKRSKAA